MLPDPGPAPSVVLARLAHHLQLLSALSPSDVEAIDALVADCLLYRQRELVGPPLVLVPPTA